MGDKEELSNVISKFGIKEIIQTALQNQCTDVVSNDKPLRQLLEAKVRVDRNSKVTTAFLLNSNFADRLANSTEESAKHFNKSSMTIWGADVMVYDEIPDNFALAMALEDVEGYDAVTNENVGCWYNGVIND